MPRSPTRYDRLAVLKQIAAYIATHGEAPVRRELADLFDASVQSIQRPVTYLNAAGYIRITEARQRNIEITDLGQRSVAAGRLLEE